MQDFNILSVEKYFSSVCCDLRQTAYEGFTFHCGDSSIWFPSLLPCSKDSWFDFLWFSLHLTDLLTWHLCKWLHVKRAAYSFCILTQAVVCLWDFKEVEISQEELGLFYRMWKRKKTSKNKFASKSPFLSFSYGEVHPFLKTIKLFLYLCIMELRS